MRPAHMDQHTVAFYALGEKRQRQCQVVVRRHKSAPKQNASLNITERFILGRVPIRWRRRCAPFSACRYK